jgi:hypothetical protein
MKGRERQKQKEGTAKKICAEKENRRGERKLKRKVLKYTA